MFTLTHVYIATQVVKKKTPLLVIGSILPDFVWVSRVELLYENLHNDIEDFYVSVNGSDEEMLDLALGMKLHSNKVGADLYSHFYKGGYSYKKGKVLLPDIKELTSSEDEKKMADLSHTFIEASLDLHLLNDKPEILEIYKKFSREIDFDKIAKLLSDYSGIDQELISRDVKALFDLVKPENLVSKKTFAGKVLPTLIKVSFDKRVGEGEILPILEKALKLTKGDYKKFLSETISMMKKDFFGE